MIRPIKPIYLMNEKSVDSMDKKAVKDGIKTIFKLAGVEKKIKILDYDKLSGRNYISPKGLLKEYKTVDRCLEQGKITIRKPTQLNANTIYRLCCEEIA